MNFRKRVYESKVNISIVLFVCKHSQFGLPILSRELSSSDLSSSEPKRVLPPPPPTTTTTTTLHMRSQSGAKREHVGVLRGGV